MVNNNLMYNLNRQVVGMYLSSYGLSHAYDISDN